MTLQQWADNGWLKPHRPSLGEIQALLEIADRDIADASSKAISSDWRFGIAYNAVLKLATILLAASGFRAERTLQHHRTIQAIPLILGPERRNDADYLESCRRKRNVVEYERPGEATEEDAEELIHFLASFRTEVVVWLRRHHPDLAPQGER